MASLKLKLSAAALLGVAVLTPILVTHSVRSRQMAAEGGKQLGIDHLNRTGKKLIALITFASTNGDQLPATLAEAGLAGNDYELMFQGALPKIDDRALTLVIQERQPWRTPQGGWARTYGFADGHSEIRLGPPPARLE